MNNQIEPRLVRGNLLRARKELIAVTSLLDTHGIGYHLEGGTLLGMVRDGDLLPWDHDLDISIMAEDIERFQRLRPLFFRRGRKITTRLSTLAVGPIPLGGYRIFKVKPLVMAIFKEIIPLLRHRYIVLDVFIKYSDTQHVYWIAREKVMRVRREYYDGYSEVECWGTKFRAPLNYESYLADKYGDWKTPVKEWDCALHEKTIIPV